MSATTKSVSFWTTRPDFNLFVKEMERKQVGGKITLSPHTIRFIGDRYTTDKQEEIEALRSCSAFGKTVFEHAQEDEQLAADLDRIARERKEAKEGKPKRGRKPKHETSEDEDLAHKF